MNSKNKFRFWNNMAHRYQPSDKYAIDGNGDLVAYDYETGGYDDPIPFDKSIIVAEQYTGLKDRNDKEIFENDYLIHDDGTLYRIEFDDEHGRYIFWLQKDGDYDTCNDCLELSTENMEIVGNLFEGPDEEKIENIEFDIY